jgi:hypothetical protein
VTILLLSFTFSACSSCEDEAPDLRFHTPRATIQTLLDVYGVGDVAEEEVQRRMSLGRRFQLQDPELFHLCFSDFRGPEDEGLAGYVFGSLAAAKDHLRITMTRDVATVIPEVDAGPGRPVTLRQDGDDWKIVLRESVPASVQQRLRAVYRRSVDQHQRAGQAR